MDQLVTVLTISSKLVPFLMKHSDIPPQSYLPSPQSDAWLGFQVKAHDCERSFKMCAYPSDRVEDDGKAIYTIATTTAKALPT